MIFRSFHLAICNPVHRRRLRQLCRYNKHNIIIVISCFILISSAFPTEPMTGLLNDGQISMLETNKKYSTSTSLIESLPEKEDEQNFHVAEFLENGSKPVTEPPTPTTTFLPVLEETGSRRRSNNMSNILSRLLRNIIIDRNSLSRIQFFNMNSSEFLTTDRLINNENSSTPNVEFGSPLCLGLCFTGQVYSDNTSIRILSDKQFSLIGTPQSPSDEDTVAQINEIGPFGLGAVNSYSASIPLTSNDTGILSWLSSSWSSITSLPLFPDFPLISNGVSQFIG